MKFELIKMMDGLKIYGDIPSLPVDYSDEQGERYVGEESDSWLLLEDMVHNIDPLINNLLDYGDVDYFSKEKCIVLKKWLNNRKEKEMSPRLNELYAVLSEYVDKAIDLGTGVVIEL